LRHAVPAFRPRSGRERRIACACAVPNREVNKSRLLRLIEAARQGGGGGRLRSRRRSGDALQRALGPRPSSVPAWGGCPRASSARGGASKRGEGSGGPPPEGRQGAMHVAGQVLAVPSLWGARGQEC